MRHSGIIHFLGTTRKQYGDSWLIVLQFAENVSHGSTWRTERARWWSEPRYLQDKKKAKQKERFTYSKQPTNALTCASAVMSSWSALSFVIQFSAFLCFTLHFKSYLWYSTKKRKEKHSLWAMLGFKIYNGPKNEGLKSFPFEFFITFGHKYLPLFLDFRVLFAHSCGKNLLTGRRHWSYASLCHRGLRIFTLTSIDMVCVFLCVCVFCLVVHIVLFDGSD